MPKAKVRTVSVRRVRNKSDRFSGSGAKFISLKEGESFEGYPLFVPDPEIEDNIGYIEYFEHYTQANGYVPCAGEDCPFCKVGDRANTRAKTLWLVTKLDDQVLSEPELRIFNFNWTLINEFVDLMSEGEKIRGRLFRMKRIDDRGGYRARSRDGKLTKQQEKDALKDAPDIEEMVFNQLKRALEALDIKNVLEDVDDDDDEELEEKLVAPKKAKKATPVVEDDDDDDDDEAEAEEDDDDDEDAAEAVSDDDEEDEGSEWPASLADVEVTIVAVNSDDETLEISHPEYGDTTLWFTDDMEVDFDSFEDGQKVLVSASTDDEGDLVADSTPAPKKKGKAKAKK